jgi:hypothetical protein
LMFEAGAGLHEAPACNVLGVSNFVLCCLPDANRVW